MFGLFRKKPKYSALQIMDELGALAGNFTDAASTDSDIEVALQGAAVISTIIEESKNWFKLTVNKGTIFSEFLGAQRDQDLQKMAEMIRNMSNGLNEVSTKRHKGALIYFWFKGDN